MSGKGFRQTHLAPVFPDSQVVAVERFPYNYVDVVELHLDLDRWSLNVAGVVVHPGRYTMTEIRQLPSITQNTRHICGMGCCRYFGGVRLADVLDHIGADDTAGYVTVTCADRYYESLDMATARQPQTLLCYDMYGRPLNRGHGPPLRLQMPTTLGYKQAKYLLTLEVVHELGPRRSYWRDLGYSRHAGL